MTQKEAAKILDQLEDSCARAENSKKDTDLLIALRVLYLLMEERVKKGADEKRTT